MRLYCHWSHSQILRMEPGNEVVVLSLVSFSDWSLGMRLYCRWSHSQIPRLEPGNEVVLFMAQK